MSQQSDADEEIERLIGEGRLRHEAWERGLEAGVLLGLSCGECGYVTATPKAACPRCGSREISTTRLPTTGRVYTKTTVEVAPEAHGGPYQIALIDLGDARILGRIADGDRVEITDRVRFTDTYRYDGSLTPVFEPV